MEAQYRDECDKCRKTFEVGDEIAFVNNRQRPICRRCLYKIPVVRR